MITEAAGETGVAAPLEHNLADTVDFVEWTRERFRDQVRQVIVGRVAGRAA